jgi:Protein of unknown function (DUF3108)
MISFRPLLAALSLLPVRPVLAAPFTAFTDGETFTYKASWGIFIHAGDIVVTAHEEKSADSPDVFRITTDTTTRGFLRGFYMYSNQAEGIINQQTGRLAIVREKGTDGEHVTDTETTFDYDRKIAWYVDHHRPNRSQEAPIPDGDPIDLISALVETRDWNLQPGEKKDVLVNFGNEFYPLAIYAERYEEVRTPLGTYHTLVLVPRMEQNPRGIFKRGGEFKVWISQQGQKLPVKMQLKLKFGTATLQLVDYKKTTPEQTKPGS